MYLLQSISDINDIFECFLHQLEIESFENFTSEDLREVCIKYVEENSDTVEVCRILQWKHKINIHVT